MGALSLTRPQVRTYREWFEDLRCDEGDIAPRHLQSHLTALGGTTIHGKPLFRIARAESLGRKLAIDFPIWREGDDPNNVIPIREAVEMMNCGLVRIAQSGDDEDTQRKKRSTLAKEVYEFVIQTADAQGRPLRRDEGYRWVSKYPCRGIVIEKWNPPDNYGNPAEWEAKKILGFSFCGPYPHEGDYEMVGSEEEEDEELLIVNLYGSEYQVPRSHRLPWPTKDKITLWIRRYWEVLETQPEDPFTRTMLRVAEFQQRELARYQRLQKEFEPLVKDLEQILHSVSLEAGRLREQMVRQSRLLHYGKGVGHVGA